MSRRAHYEAQIVRFDSTFGHEFDKALNKLLVRNGLGWFHDDQIKEIRDEMVRAEFRRQKDAARSRAHYAAQRTAS